jgi:hypothetical protein
MPTVSMAAIVPLRAATRNRANVMSGIGQMTMPTSPDAAGP